MAPACAESIAASLATFTRVEALPREPLGYGRDLVCLDDIDPSMQELDPFSVQGIRQGLYHRLSTPRGLLPDDRDGGLDVVGMLNSGYTSEQLRLMEAAVTVECRKDDRVSEVVVTVTRPTPRSLRFEIVVTPEDPLLGTFTMVVALVNGQALLEAITR